MAYILFVNPSILGTVILLPAENTFGQLMTTTALAAAIGTLMMGLIARYPFALAPGMGLNAYFAYTVVMQHQIAWQTALGAVFISGVAFFILSVTGVRELVVNAIPAALKCAIAGGIGLFLAFIGLVNGGMVIDHPATLVTLGNPTDPQVLLMLFGLIVTVALGSLHIPGAILSGILATTGLAILVDAPVFQGKAFAGLTHGIIQAPAWPVDLWMEMDVVAALELGGLGIVFVFLFVDFFDTAGTLIGLSHTAGFTNKDGELPRASHAFACDAVATAAGACMGTSSTTSYIESAAGIDDGGRTGLTAVVIAILFLASIFFWPLASIVPAVATAPALIVVGASMMRGLSEVKWTDQSTAVPVFLTVISMPLMFSIANGIALGLISFVAIALFTGRARSVHWLMWALAILLVCRYAWLATG